MPKQESKNIQDIRNQLQDSLAKKGHKLLRAQEVKPAQGLKTCWHALDEFLIGGGLPCGEVSLLQANEGLGATTLWLDTARACIHSGGQAVWINSATYQLNPITAKQRGVDLNHLLFINLSESETLFRTLQDIITARVFPIIGCELAGPTKLTLREIKALHASVRQTNTGLIFLAHITDTSTTHTAHARNPMRHASRMIANIASVANTVLEIQNQNGIVLKTPHRQVPHTLERSPQHAKAINTKSSSRYPTQLT